MDKIYTFENVCRLKSIKDVRHRKVKRYTTRCFPSQWSMRHPSSDGRMYKDSSIVKYFLNMVGVLDVNKKPLMHCSEKRARKLMERGEAKGYYKKGIFCIILQRPPKTNFKQNICIGIDKINVLWGIL